MSIKSIKARQIFDSRGNPTVEVDLVTAKGNRRLGLTLVELPDLLLTLSTAVISKTFSLPGGGGGGGGGRFRGIFYKIGPTTVQRKQKKTAKKKKERNKERMKGKYQRARRFEHFRLYGYTATHHYSPHH